MSLDDKLSLLESRLESLILTSKQVKQQNLKLKTNEVELMRKNNLAKTKVEDMIDKLKSLDT